VAAVPASEDLARRTLAILFIAALLAICLWIVRPFLPATIWATTLVIATWPILLRLQDRLWNRRGLAATVMTLALLLIFVVPLWLAIDTIVTHSGDILGWASSASLVVPAPPDWLDGVPVVGHPTAQAWQNLADSEAHDLLQRFRPYAGRLTNWFLSAVGSFGTVLMQFLLTVVIAALLYMRGERAAAYVKRFGLRLAGERGVQAVVLAGQAIRGVALGVVVTAFIQAAIASAALVVTGVPYASILSAIIFMLCIAQLGPALVMLPAVGWMYWRGDAGTATVLLVLSLIAISVDNVLRPILIKKGVDLPLLLILTGVVGGLVAFGLIGIFLGPTVLAVGFKLLDAWIHDGQRAGQQQPKALQHGE